MTKTTKVFFFVFERGQRQLQFGGREEISCKGFWNLGLFAEREAQDFLQKGHANWVGCVCLSVCVGVGKSYRQLFHTLKPEKCKIIF